MRRRRNADDVRERKVRRPWAGHHWPKPPPDRRGETPGFPLTRRPPKGWPISILFGQAGRPTPPVSSGREEFITPTLRGCAHVFEHVAETSRHGRFRR